MATATHGSLASLLVNGYDLSPFLNTLGLSGAIDMVDETCFGPIGVPVTSKSYIPGMEDGSLKGDGKYVIDETGLTLDQIADVLEAAIAAQAVGSVGSAVCTYLPLGDGFGVSAYELLANIAEYDVTSPVTAIVAVSVNLQSSIGARGAAALQPAVAVAGTVNGATLDAGATYNPAKFKGLIANLHVIDKGTGVTAKVQHSVDGTTWVDLVTFTIGAASHKAENKQVLGTVNRYLRSQVVAATTATVHIAAGRVPVF